MIINIFRIFDPVTSNWIPFPNWIRSLILIIMLPLPIWIQSSRFSIVPHSISKFLFNEFKTLINSSISNLIVFISVFFIILLNNFIGLFPHIFTSTSHIRFCLSLSLPIWLGIISFRISSYFNNLISHLTPQGTPTALIPFIVIIESLRLIIRPITLSIRLRANIIAGHLLISLIGSSGPLLASLTLATIIIVQNLLVILEIRVSIIQAYVFSILSTLYRREI